MTNLRNLWIKSALPEFRMQCLLFCDSGRISQNYSMTPDDFMFEMTDIEFKNWRSQFVTSKGDRMGLRYKPMVFREQGVAMLSSVVRSKKAILVNIQIMRAFIQLRQMYIRHEDLKRKIEVMENKFLSPLSDCVFGESTKRNKKETLCELCLPR